MIFDMIEPAFLLFLFGFIQIMNLIKFNKQKNEIQALNNEISIEKNIESKDKNNVVLERISGIDKNLATLSNENIGINIILDKAGSEIEDLLSKNSELKLEISNLTAKYDLLLKKNDEKEKFNSLTDRKERLKLVLENCKESELKVS